MAEDEFRVVSRRKAKRHVKHSNKQNILASHDIASDADFDKDNFMVRLLEAKQELALGGVWKEYDQALCAGLVETQGTKDVDNLQCGANQIPTRGDGLGAGYEHFPWKDIVCYGLGKFSSCYIARYQLALLLLLNEHIKPSKCFVYDPVFSSQEKEVLEELGYEIICKNEEGKRAVTEKTLFLMPHCGKPLYNNLLWSNWGQPLQNLTIIGNSFSKMEETLVSRIFEEKLKYIHDVLPFVEEIRVSPGVKFGDVFNDTSIHTFLNIITEPFDNELWTRGPEPVYDTADLEIIVN